MVFDEKDTEFFENFENNYYSDIKQQYISLKDNNDVENLRDLVNPNRMYGRLGVDILAVQVSANILPIIDPYFVYETQVLRQLLTDEYGYIIPNMRVMDNSSLENYEFEIDVRQKCVYSGKISEEDLKSNNPRELVKSLYKVCFDYVHYIMTKTDALKLMELVRSQDPMLIENIFPDYLSPFDLKHICANLIQRKIGIKDIVFIFEILNENAKNTQDINELTNIIKKELTFAPQEKKPSCKIFQNIT